MGEGACLQCLPIEFGALGLEAELGGKRRQARHRQRWAIDQVAAADGADIGIDGVLDPEPEQAGQSGLAGNDGIAGVICPLGNLRFAGNVS